MAWRPRSRGRRTPAFGFKSWVWDFFDDACFFVQGIL
jgi:hypothetical protein